MVAHIEDEVWIPALYQRGKQLLEQEQFEVAMDVFSSIADYRDSRELWRQACECYEDRIFEMMQEDLVQISLEEELERDEANRRYWPDEGEIWDAMMGRIEELEYDRERLYDKWNEYISEKKRIQSKIERTKRSFDQPTPSQVKLEASARRLEDLRQELSRTGFFNRREKRRIRSEIEKENEVQQQLSEKAAIEIAQQNARKREALGRLMIKLNRCNESIGRVKDEIEKIGNHIKIIKS